MIAPNAVLTAAHCVAGRLSSLTITAGDHDRTKNEGTEQVVKVCTLANDCGEFVNVHPDWNRLNLTGDLAVINLPTPFDIIPGNHRFAIIHYIHYDLAPERLDIIYPQRFN